MFSLLGEVVTHYRQENIKLVGRGNGVRSLPTTVPLPNRQGDDQLAGVGLGLALNCAFLRCLSVPLDFALLLDEAQTYHPHPSAHEFGS